MNTKHAVHSIATFCQALAALLFVVVLYVARDVCIPLALGILFAFLLSPIVNRLQRLGLSNVLAVLTTATVVFAGFTLFILLLWNGVSSFGSDLPKYRSELQAKMRAVRQMVGALGGNLLSFADEITGQDGSQQKLNPGSTVDSPDNRDEGSSSTQRNESSSQPGTPSRLDGSTPQQALYVIEAPSGKIDVRSWAGGVATVLGPVGTTGLVMVFALFALLYRDDLRDRFTSVVSKGNYVVTTDALDEASRRISRYLMAQLTLNVTYGIVFASGLALIGFLFVPDRTFPYVMVLGTFAGLVRFLPYVGPLMGAAVPLLFSIALFPGYTIVTSVAVLILVMELLSNNVVEPLVYGSSTGVSAVAIIIAAVFWGWLWGPIGLLLATPMTVCAVVLGRYVPRFRFLAMLLSDEVQIKSSVRGYQRLLAGDDHKLAEFLRAELKDKPLAQVMDETVVPMIKRILNDRDSHGTNDATMFQRLRVGLETLQVLPQSRENVEDEPTSSDSPSDDVESVIESDELAGGEATNDQTTITLPSGIAIAARHGGEAMVLEAMAEMLSKEAKITLFQSDDVPDREATEIVDLRPDFILIGVIPPNGISQGRYWCRSLRKAGYDDVILVTCLGKFRNFDRLFSGFRRVGATWVATTVAQTLSKINNSLNLTPRVVGPNNPQERGCSRIRSGN